MRKCFNIASLSHGMSRRRVQGDGGEVALQRRPGRGRGYRALGLSLLSFLNIFFPSFFTAGSLSHSYKSSAAQGDFCPVYFSPCACVCVCRTQGWNSITSLWCDRKRVWANSHGFKKKKNALNSFFFFSEGNGMWKKMPQSFFQTIHKCALFVCRIPKVPIVYL